MSEGNGRKPPLRGYDRLWIFRRSLAALNAVFELSEKFPEKEAEKLTHPIRQSAFWVSLFSIRAWVRRRKVRQALKDLREASNTTKNTCNTTYRDADSPNRSESQLPGP